MELSVVVLREGSGRGGVRLWVISGEGQMSERTTVQKIKLSLQPQQLQAQSQDIAYPIDHDSPEDVPSGQTDSSVTVSPYQVSDELRSRYAVQPQDYS